MASVAFQYDLNQHGINKIINIKVRDVVDGKTPDQQFPRDDLEKQKLTEIIAIELAKNKSGVINEALELGNRRKEMINDPIGTMIKERAAQAYDSASGPGVNIGTTMAEITQLLPGGKTFEPGKAMEGVLNTGAAILTGKDQAINQAWQGHNDPKQTVTDIGVIGTDLALAAALTKDVPNNKFTTRNAIFNQIKKNPALGFATIVGTNVAAKQAGDLFYDLLNDMTRQIMQLPNPDEAYK